LEHFQEFARFRDGVLFTGGGGGIPGRLGRGDGLGEPSVLGVSRGER
jgi:hypothetical protein